MKALSQILLVIAIVAALSGAVVLLLRQSSGRSIEILLPTPTREPQQLQVYVTGAVKSPGLYILKPDDRVAQAIEAAGGAVEGADLGRVNLAAKVRDEDHLLIPRVGEVVASVSGEASASGKININTASAKLLESLPKIGPVLAQAVVSYREKNGPFSRIEDLVKVPGIGSGILEAVRGLVTVD